VSDINDLLNNPGMYIFDPGEHSLDDNIDIGSDDVTIVIHPKATITFPDDSSAETITDDQGSNHTYLIRSIGFDNVSIINYGTLDSNNGPISGGEGIYVGNCDGCTIEFGGGGSVVNAADCIWLVDSSDLSINNTTGYDYVNSVVVAEGCSDSEITNPTGVSGDETVDLNALNESVTVDRAVGKDLTGQVVDVDRCRECSILNTEAKGSTDSILQINSDGGSRFTDKTSLTDYHGNTAHGVFGTVNGLAIEIHGPNPFHNTTITGIDVVSTEDTAVEIRPEGPNVADGLVVEGRAETRAGDNASRAFDFWEGDSQNNLSVDITAVSDSDRHVSIGDWDDISGSIKSRGNATNGVVLVGLSGGGVADVDLSVHAQGSGSARDIWITGDGSVSDVAVSGWIEQTFEVKSGVGNNIRLDAIRGSVNDPDNVVVEADYS
jgi:hypothetical protein